MEIRIDDEMPSTVTIGYENVYNMLEKIAKIEANDRLFQKIARKLNFVLFSSRTMQRFATNTTDERKCKKNDNFRDLGAVLLKFLSVSS